MTTDTLTLTDFLLARIAEDEEAARHPRYDMTDHWWLPDYADPARVLAECAAKRAVVEWAAPELRNWPNAPEGFRYVSDDGHDLLSILAAPYAHHPDYRDEWRQ